MSIKEPSPDCVVRSANANGREIISLRYFSDVKSEIEEFFFCAGEIADGKKVRPIYKPAMIAITSGCSDSSDVISKKADFDHDIKYGFGIKEDPMKSYYGEDLFDFNLEDFKYLEEDQSTSKKETAIKLVSNIHKLRSGVIFQNDLESEHLIVTNTKLILEVSKNHVDRIKAEKGIETISGFAVSLDRITSLLWYKLGRGFGNNSFPVSVDAALQARRVLSASIAKKVERVFSETKEDYEKGIISLEKLAARYVALKSKPIKPEELCGDDIENTMDFSPEFLRRFEVEVETKEKALKEKDSVIEAMRENAKAERSEAQAIIVNKDKELASKNEENLRLQDEINKYRTKEIAEKEKKNKRKKRILFFAAVLWKLFAVATFVFVCTWICGLLSEPSKATVGVIAGVLGIIIVLFQIIKKDIKKYLK